MGEFNIAALVSVVVSLIGVGIWGTSLIPVYKHIRSLGWEPSVAHLLSLSVDQQAGSSVSSTDTVSRTRTTLNTYRINLSYTYFRDGKEYQGSNPTFFNYYDGSLDGKGDGWRGKISDHVQKSSTGQFGIWVNPQDPSESVVIRDIRWFAFGVHFLAGTVLLLIGFTLLVKAFNVQLIPAGVTLGTPEAINKTVLGLVLIYAIPTSVVSVLLFRDQRFILGALSLLPLLIFLNGLRIILFSKT